MKLLIVALLALAPVIGHAQTEKWLKQANPGSLGLFISSRKPCPFTLEQIKNKIEGEFLRARIKPTKDLKLNLTISINCLKIENKAGNSVGFAVYHQIRFGTQLGTGEFMLYEDPNLGRLYVSGMDEEQFIMNTITDDVNEAITMYLKANF